MFFFPVAKTAPERLTTEESDKPKDSRHPLLTHVCQLQVTSKDVEESVKRINALLSKIDGRSVLTLDPVGRGRRSQASLINQFATVSPLSSIVSRRHSTGKIKADSFTRDEIQDNLPGSGSDAGKYWASSDSRSPSPSFRVAEKKMRRKSSVKAGMEGLTTLPEESGTPGL